MRWLFLLLTLLAPVSARAQGVPAGAPPGAAVPSTNPAPSAHATGSGAPVITDPQPGPPQPIPFNHKLHVGTAKLGCNDCHAPSKNGATVAMPQAGKCMICHAAVDADKPDIQQLAAAAKSGEPIVWNRVYAVPSFVQFSHKTHMDTGSQCADCHGDVAQQEVIARVRDISMGGCISCHTAKAAPVGCGTCHELQSLNRHAPYTDVDRVTLARLGLESVHPGLRSRLPGSDSHGGTTGITRYLTAPEL